MSTTTFVDTPPTTTGPRAGVREWSALVVLMLPVLLVSVDNTVLNFALPAISEALRPTGVQLLWMIDVYPLVLAGLLVPMGSLGDRFGRRRLLLIGATGFAVVSAIAAFAPDAAALIGARALLGVFGAMLMPSTLSLLRGIFVDREQRRLAIAVWASGFAGGSALGPIVGGLLLEHFPWGSVFVLAVPVLVPLVILLPILVPESRDPAPGPIDPLSILLSLATMLPLVYAIKSVASHGFAVDSTLGIVLGLASGFAFVRRQLGSDTPMLDMSLFRRGAFSGAVGVNLLSVTAYVGGLFFVSQHLQLVLGMSPLAAGLVLVPGLVVMIASGLIVVPIAKRVRPSVVIPVGLSISAAAYALVALSGGHVTAVGLAVIFMGLGLGIGAAETVSNELIISTAPADKAGAASAVSETAYELGAVLGTAVLGTILTASYRANVVMPASLTEAQSAATSETLGGAVSVAERLPAEVSEALLASARDAFGSGVGIAAWIGSVLIVVAMVVARIALRRAR